MTRRRDLPAAEAAQTRTRVTTTQEPPVAAGTIIRRRYVLERLIGSGGMGQVWKAKDLVSERARDPNPYVAIKLLNANFEADPDAFVSLQRETKKSQELAHPNVATVYTFDTDDGGSGRAFMSMELLQGETLDDFIDSHKRGLTRTEALPLIVGMAKGLEYAHRKGIVHSDFKPGNVFVTDDGNPKVLDFGIARAAKIAGVERREDSFDAGTLGGLTLAYASPEMIEQREPHPADDVYALGLVAYELLAGKPPFNLKSAVEMRNAGMAPPRIRSIRRYEWQAIRRALEFDRSKRWQSAGEFLRAYEGKSIAIAGLAALAVCLALVAGVFWYQGYAASRPAVPLEALPAQTQADFRKEMSDGDGEWRLVQQGHREQILEAVRAYGRAYALHPRDSDAIAGLRRTADYILDRSRADPDPAERLQMLESVSEASEYYAGYQPLRIAIKEAGGKE
ncbi:MAG: serine/threonine-protein kinase [Steroidobacteraceae bacterium]